MARKKVIVEGVGLVILSNHVEYKELLTTEGVKCLLDEEGTRVGGFESLLDGGRYTLGQWERTVEPQQYVAANHLQQLPEADIMELVEFVRKQKADSETLILSCPKTERFNKAMSAIGIPKDSPTWDNKPTDSDGTPREPPSYKWLSSKEDSPENRKGYMEYLQDLAIVSLPKNTALFEGSVDPDLLSAHLQGFGVKTSGNIDVILANSRHQDITTVRQNMLAGIELKKDTNNAHTQIERQITMQHMAASYLNPDTGILTVMTDLDSRWHFFWFVQRRRLMRYKATKQEAFYLIEHMLDDDAERFMPEGFGMRASWNEIFLSTMSEGYGEDRSHGAGTPEDCDKGDDYHDDEPENRVGERSVGRRGSSSLVQPKEEHSNPHGGQHVMTDVVALEFIDEYEKHETIFSRTLEASCHRMFPPQHTSKQDGIGPPSEISF